MTGPGTPSRLVRALLRFTQPSDAAAAIIGDAIEDLEERTGAGRAPRWPRLWLEWQIVRFAIAAARTSLSRTAGVVRYTVRDAVRSLGRQPAHALVILLVLGVGISAATVTFTVVDAVLFRPLQLDPDQQLVSMRIATSKRPRRLSGSEAQAVRDGSQVIATMADYTVGTAPAAIDGAKQNLQVGAVSPEFFQLLGLTTQIGRVWSPADVALTSDVAVITDRFWRQTFAGDPGVLGRRIDVSDGPRLIIGVLTPDADAAFAEIAWPTQVFVPPSSKIGYEAMYGFGPIAKLRPGVTMPQAAAGIQAIVAPLAAKEAAADPSWAVSVTSWRSATVRVDNVRDWMLLVLGAVGLIVLIACVNAATVLLTRSNARAHELAIRASLGASRRSLAGALLAESLILSVAASACALLCTAWGLEWVRSMLPAAVPRVTAIALNGRVFGAAALAAMVTGLFFGALPAWDASRASVTGLLKDGGTTGTANRRRWRTVLLVTQVSCVAVLLVLSTLFVGSFVRMAWTDLGFERSHLLAASTVTDYEGTVDDVKARLARIPGVTGVAAATYSSLPLVASAYGGAWGASTLRSADDAGAATVKAEIYRVTGNYFDVAGIQFRAGSTWSMPPTADWRPIVIDQAVAHELFGEGSPLGRLVQGTDLTGVFTIVGIVNPARTRGPEGRTSPGAYTAIAPNARPSWVSFFLRTAGPPESLVRVVEAEVAAVSTPNESPGAGVYVVNDAYRRLTSTRRFTGVLMGLFAVIQLLIGTAGIYAVTSSVVAQQAREFGVRVALGATAGDIRRAVLGGAVKRVLVGLAIGLPIAWWISRGFSALFFNVQPSDITVYLVVSVLLLGAAIVAAAVPARRATRLDPVVTLRT